MMRHESTGGVTRFRQESCLWFSRTTHHDLAAVGAFHEVNKKERGKNNLHGEWLVTAKGVGRWYVSSVREELCHGENDDDEGAQPLGKKNFLFLNPCGLGAQTRNALWAAENFDTADPPSHNLSYRTLLFTQSAITAIPSPTPFCST